MRWEGAQGAGPVGGSGGGEGTDKRRGHCERRRQQARQQDCLPPQGCPAGAAARQGTRLVHDGQDKRHQGQEDLEGQARQDAGDEGARDWDAVHKAATVQGWGGVGWAGGATQASRRGCMRSVRSGGGVHATRRARMQGTRDARELEQSSGRPGGPMPRRAVLCTLVRRRRRRARFEHKDRLQVRTRRRTAAAHPKKEFMVSRPCTAVTGIMKNAAMAQKAAHMAMVRPAERGGGGMRFHEQFLTTSFCCTRKMSFLISVSIQERQDEGGGGGGGALLGCCGPATLRAGTLVQVQTGLPPRLGPRMDKAAGPSLRKDALRTSCQACQQPPSLCVRG